MATTIGMEPIMLQMITSSIEEIDDFVTTCNQIGQPNPLASYSLSILAFRDQIRNLIATSKIHGMDKKSPPLHL